LVAWDTMLVLATCSLSATRPDVPGAATALMEQDPPAYRDTHKCNDNPTDFVVRGITALDNPDKAHCTFAMLQKSGSTTLRSAFLAGITKNADALCERGGLGPWNWERHDVVIGQIRNPFSWYASLWDYNSDELDERHGRHSEYPELSRRMPRGSTEDDRERFRTFVRKMSAPSVGLLSLHMWINYLHTSEKPIFGLDTWDGLPDFLSEQRPYLRNASITLETIAADLKAWAPHREAGQQQRVACWVKSENAEDDLRTCLRKCTSSAKTRTVVDWAAFNTTLKKKALDNPSSERVSDAELYDAETIAFVAEADKHLFRVFGYPLSLPTA